jgi:hypothetical protein
MAAFGAINVNVIGFMVACYARLGAFIAINVSAIGLILALSALVVAFGEINVNMIGFIVASGASLAPSPPAPAEASGVFDPLPQGEERSV